MSQAEVTVWVMVLAKDPGTFSFRTNLFLTCWANRSLGRLKMEAESPRRNLEAAEAQAAPKRIEPLCGSY